MRVYKNCIIMQHPEPTPDGMITVAIKMTRSDGIFRLVVPDSKEFRTLAADMAHALAFLHSNGIWRFDCYYTPSGKNTEWNVDIHLDPENDITIISDGTAKLVKWSNNIDGAEYHVKHIDLKRCLYIDPYQTLWRFGSEFGLEALDFMLDDWNQAIMVGDYNVE